MLYCSSNILYNINYFSDILIKIFSILHGKEKSRYNNAAMALDIRVNTQMWATLFLFGGVMCNSVSQWIAIAIFIIWFYLVLKKLRSNKKDN